MASTSFSSAELRLLYTSLKELTLENNKALDDPSTPADDRNLIMDENKTAFSALRKLRAVLSEFDPDYLAEMDRVYQTLS